jgi:predicted ABC-type sugar transport system permease subunit
MTAPALDQHLSANPPKLATGKWRGALLDRAPFLVACLMLLLIVLIYGSMQRGVFTLDEVNLDTAAAMTLILAATGQTIVLIRGGIDLSIGGMISLGTVIAATQFGTDPLNILMWSGLILLLGAGVGALNGLLISALKLQPFLVTLATWSILNGAAMLILPTDGGSVPSWWIGFSYSEFLGLSGPVWMLVGLLLFWAWFRSTRLGITIQATGSNEPLRCRRGDLPDDTDRGRLADHRQGLHPALGRGSRDRRRQPVRRPRQPRRHHGRRLRADVDRQPGLRHARLKLLAARRLGHRP